MQVPVDKRRAVSSIGDDPLDKPVLEKPAVWKKTQDTASSKAIACDPAILPLSERFAVWEQRSSQSPKPDRVISAKVPPTPKQSCTPAKVRDVKANQNASTTADPSEKPVSEIRASWKLQEAADSQLIAWEAASSCKKVGSIKNVVPNSLFNSPTPKIAALKSTPSKFPSLNHHATPNIGLAHQIRVEENNEERAAQIGCKQTVRDLGLRPKTAHLDIDKSLMKVAGSYTRTTQSPARICWPSPIRFTFPTTSIGNATKPLQQNILEQTQYSKMDPLVTSISQEPMTETPVAEPLHIHPPVTAANLSESETKKQDLKRVKAREDFNTELQSMGCELLDEVDACLSFKKDQQQSDQGALSLDNNQLQRQVSFATKKTTSIYRLVSKKYTAIEKPMVKKRVATEKPVARQQSPSSLKKSQFKNANISMDTGCSSDVVEWSQNGDIDVSSNDDDKCPEEHMSGTQKSLGDTCNSESELIMPESTLPNQAEFRSPDSYENSLKHTNSFPRPVINIMDDDIDDDDDISFSAFVPISVRRQSILPKCIVYGDLSEDCKANTPCQPSRSFKKDLNIDESIEMNSPTTNKQTDDHWDSDNEYVASVMDQELDEGVNKVEMRKKETVAIPKLCMRKSLVYATTEGEQNLPQDSVDAQTHPKSDNLAYSVSMYRSNRLSQESPVIIQRVSPNTEMFVEDVDEEDVETTAVQPDIDMKIVHDRIKELQELVNQEQSVIVQTSNALNKCCTEDSKFAGSTEQVECNRLLLVASQKQNAYLTEIQRLKDTGELEPKSQQCPKGSLVISDIRLPLKKEFVTKIGTSSDIVIYYFVILVHNGPQVLSTPMLSTHDPTVRGSLDFPNIGKIHGISANFCMKLEIYCMPVSRELTKDKKKKTPKKFKISHMAMNSPVRTNAVLTTHFMLATTVPLTMKCMDLSSFTLDNITFLSPLHGMIYMKLHCAMEQRIEERGFLTMFEDASGLGSWHRRWCVLAGNKLCYWKYPDDETKKDPLGLIDLKRVITEKVGLIPRDVCARPNTFELVSVQPPRYGEQDIPITKTYNTITTTKFIMSSDTKDERIIWTDKVNQALVNIRTWQSDALQPIKPTVIQKTTAENNL